MSFSFSPSARTAHSSICLASSATRAFSLSETASWSSRSTTSSCKESTCSARSACFLSESTTLLVSRRTSPWMRPRCFRSVSLSLSALSALSSASLACSSNSFSLFLKASFAGLLCSCDLSCSISSSSVTCSYELLRVATCFLSKSSSACNSLFAIRSSTDLSSMSFRTATIIFSIDAALSPCFLNTSSKTSWPGSESSTTRLARPDVREPASAFARRRRLAAARAAAVKLVATPAIETAPAFGCVDGIPVTARFNGFKR
mmetsp:Transcript_56110/g.142021  ORF Transcript_56110/g.142021 Transcript_56110/m.142021 type:complete len:260 (+) Transcript_56110:750-1529(+)